MYYLKNKENKMRKISKIVKLVKRANKLAKGYQEARDKEFNEQLANMVDPAVVWTEEDVQKFLIKFDEDYPLETNWSWNEANAELDEPDA